MCLLTKRAIERWNELQKNKLKSPEKKSDSVKQTTKIDKAPKEAITKKDKAPKQEVKEAVVIKDGQLFEGISKLHKDGQFDQITGLVKKRLGTEEFLNGLNSSSLNVIINSLFLTVNIKKIQFVCKCIKEQKNL